MIMYSEQVIIKPRRGRPFGAKDKKPRKRKVITLKFNIPVNRALWEKKLKDQPDALKRISKRIQQEIKWELK